MNTSSSISTPSQMNEWEEILQRLPMVAFFWISTNAPILVPLPIRQPYKFTRSCWKIVTSFSSTTVSEMGTALASLPSVVENVEANVDAHQIGSGISL